MSEDQRITRAEAEQIAEQAVQRAFYRIGIKDEEDVQRFRESMRLSDMIANARKTIGTTILRAVTWTIVTALVVYYLGLNKVN